METLPSSPEHDSGHRQMTQRRRSGSHREINQTLLVKRMQAQQPRLVSGEPKEEINNKLQRKGKIWKLAEPPRPPRQWKIQEVRLMRQPHPRLTRHHLKPASIGGTWDAYNIIMLWRDKHDAWHQFFRNLDFDFIVEVVTTGSFEDSWSDYHHSLSQIFYRTDHAWVAEVLLRIQRFKQRLK